MTISNIGMFSLGEYSGPHTGPQLYRVFAKKGSFTRLWWWLKDPFFVDTLNTLGLRLYDMAIMTYIFSTFNYVHDLPLKEGKYVVKNKHC